MSKLLVLNKAHGASGHITTKMEAGCPRSMYTRGMETACRYWRSEPPYMVALSDYIHWASRFTSSVQMSRVSALKVEQ